MAKKSKSPITLLNVIEYPAGSFNSMGVISNHDRMENIYIMKLMGATKQKMQILISGKDFKDLKIDFNITFGNPYRQIEDEMANNPADLIIMGSRGSTGAAEVLLGSNAEKVVRNSEVPVMVLHSKIKLNEIKNIFFASSFQ